VENQNPSSKWDITSELLEEATFKVEGARQLKREKKCKAEENYSSKQNLKQVKPFTAL